MAIGHIVQPCMNIRRRMKTEAKAKVVAAVWGTRIYSIPCCDSCIALSDLKKRINCTMQDDLRKKDEFILFFKIFLVQNS